ncbi:MAG TPA: SDR family oxidoreductase [Flavisolibacter sp.]|jgi:3-oxoacyl-[acyl-carrier protein] reductase|nr:SDR family oxidoreductase [Flavisolibacter sp.]
MNLSLEGKTALVCGSSQGIGLAVAEELALMGANCILLARNEDNLKKAVHQLDSSLRQSHCYYSIDFSDREATRRLIKDLTATQTIHILVNNSGGPKAGAILEAEEDQFLRAFEQHLLVDHILVTHVMEGMKKEGYGRIINIISTSVKIPLPNLGVSNTIRGAVASWAKTLSYELAPFGITVNNVLPGFTETERLQSLIQHNAQVKKRSAEQEAEMMRHDVPAKRFGTASEIAAMAAFLATPAAAYVNGTSIPVDGGRTGSI